MFTEPITGFTIMSIVVLFLFRTFPAISTLRIYSPNHSVDSSFCISVACLAYTLRGLPVHQGVMLVGIMMLGLGMTLAMMLIGERGEIGVTYTCIYSALLSWEDPYGLSPH